MNDEYEMSDPFIEELLALVTNLQVSGTSNREILSWLRQHPNYNFAKAGQPPSPVRDRECQVCAHKWTSPVRLSPYTPNLSGEATEHCPMCNTRNIISYPQRKDYYDNFADAAKDIKKIKEIPNE